MIMAKRTCGYQGVRSVSFSENFACDISQRRQRIFWVVGEGGG